MSGTALSRYEPLPLTVTEGMSARTDRLLAAGEAETRPAAAKRARIAVCMM